MLDEEEISVFTKAAVFSASEGVRQDPIVASLRSYVKASGGDLELTDECLLRWYLSRKENVEKTKRAIGRHLTWRKKEGIHSPKSSEAEQILKNNPDANTAVVSTTGTGQCTIGRPCIFVYAQLHDKSAQNDASMRKFLAHKIEEALQRGVYLREQEAERLAEYELENTLSAGGNETAVQAAASTRGMATATLTASASASASNDGGIGIGTGTGTGKGKKEDGDGEEDRAEGEESKTGKDTSSNSTSTSSSSSTSTSSSSYIKIPHTIPITCTPTSTSTPTSYMSRYRNIDTFTLIFDLNNFGLSNMNYDAISSLINLITYNYPYVIERVVILNAPWIFNTCWSLIKILLSDEAASLIGFVNSLKEMELYVPIDNIPPCVLEQFQ